MKILVDEMPKNTEECPYSQKEGNKHGDTWFGCTYRGVIACFDVNKCPYFTALPHCKGETHNERNN